MRGKIALCVWFLLLIGIAHTHPSHVATGLLITPSNLISIRAQLPRKLALNVGLPVCISGAHLASGAARLCIPTNTVHERGRTH